ncbi:MAG: HU family DNA-binding protein [bacterium]|nr:HU family DNA-binding protein [bacterium]
MVKADLVTRAMEAARVEGPVARKAVGALLESLSGALQRGDRVVLRRFGVLQAAPRRTGMARDPRTGEPVAVPPGRVVRFRPAPGLRGITGER